MQRLCHPVHVSTLCNLLLFSSEPKQRLCHPGPVLNLGPRQHLCHPVHSITCMSKLSQQNTPLWFHTSRFRFVLPVTCSKFTDPFSTQFLSWLESSNLSNDFVWSCSNKILSKLFEHRASSWVELKFNPNTFKLTLQISSPRFPLLLFTLSHAPTHRLHYRSLHLSGYSTKSYCYSSRWTPCQLSSTTRCWTSPSLSTKNSPRSTSQAQGFWKPSSAKTVQTCKTSRPQISSLPVESATRTAQAHDAGNHHHETYWIHFTGYYWHADSSIPSNPSLVWQRLQSTCLSPGSVYLLCMYLSLHDYIRFRFHKSKLQWSEQQKSFLTCLWHISTVQVQV